ncbi:MAG: L-fucose/L-arabinose isomerase family protein, partial [Anaerovoracaceae bacterium]
MEKSRVKIGFCPTRRFVFSKEDAHKYKKLTLEKLKKMNVDVVDIEDLNEEGLVYDDVSQVAKVVNKFKREEVDAVFIPHCNFGTENTVSSIASKVGKPVLLWGPRDESPLPSGERLRDSQCGLFATGKVLRRFNVPYTYILNSRLDDLVFTRGLEVFISTANIVKAFNNIRILQIGTRPAGFWTMIVNEGELLERFGIEVFPIEIEEIKKATLNIEREKKNDFVQTVNYIRQNWEHSQIPEEFIDRIAALKVAIKEYLVAEQCSAVAVQCWSAMQEALGIMPCASASMLMEEGVPVMCETDIHGAVSAIMLQAARMNETPVFFADMTVRHPEIDNAELLFHCGPFAPSLAKEGCKPTISRHSILPSNCCGTAEFEMKGGDVTITRFD